jgi:hypothetical protein
MAYIKDEDQEQAQTGMNVISPAPETGTTPVPVPQQGTTTAPTTTAAPTKAPASATKPKKTAGSGMFTNIRRYIEANKPATQKMTQNVIGKVEQEAGQVGQALEQKQQAYQQQLRQNQQNLQQAQQFGTEMLQRAGQSITPEAGQIAEPTQYFTPSEEQSQRFQQIASGEQRFADMADLNIQKQLLAARRLAQQTDAAKTAAGRAELLRKTYGQGPQEYSRGMGMLDQIILSSPEAKQQLIGRVGEIGRTGLSSAEQARATAAQELAGLRLGEKDLQEQLRTGTAEAFGGLRTGLEEQAQRYNVGMEELAGGVRGYLGGQDQLTAEQLGQLGQAGQEYLRGLAGTETGYGTGYEDYVKAAQEAGFLGEDATGIESAIQARLLGQDIEGQRRFADPELARLASQQEFARQAALERLTGRDKGFLSLYDPAELERLRVGQYTGQDIGLLTGGTASPDSYQALQSERQRQIAEQFAKEKEAAVRQFAGEYYRDIGQHTGEGAGLRAGGYEGGKAFIENEGSAFDVGHERDLYRTQAEAEIGQIGLDKLKARRKALYEAQRGRLGDVFGKLPEEE